MAWSVLQSAVSPCAFGTAVDSNPVTFGSNCSSGTVLLAYVQMNMPSPLTIVSVKDGAGNSFTLVKEYSDVNRNLEASVWMLATPAGDAGIKPVITATSSSPGVAAGGILVQEVSGIQAVLDGTASAPLNGASSGATGSPSYSSTASNEYLISYYADQAQTGQTITGPGGWTADAHDVSGSTTGGNQGVAWKNSTNGPETDGWSVSAAANWAVIEVAFQLAAPAAAGIPPAPAQPGRTWQRRFRHRQLAAPAGPQTITGTASAAGAGVTTAVITQIAPAAAAGAGAVTAASAQAAGAAAAGAGSAGPAPVTQIAPASSAGAGAVADVATQIAIASAAGAGSVTATGSVTGAGSTASAAGAASVTAVATQIAPATAAGAGAVTDTAVQAAKAAAAGAGAVTASGAITGTASAAGAGSATAKTVQIAPATAAGAGTLAALAAQQAAAALAGAGSVTAAGNIQLAFTVGTLTASDQPLAVLGAGTAATAAQNTLTAGTQTTGGPS